MKKPEKISNWTAILFKALPTCVSFHDCTSCVTQNSTFQCRWCEKVRRCSDGMDRHRQEWLQSRCDYFNSEHLEQCKLHPPVSSPVEANAAPPSTQAITKAPASTPAAAAAMDAALQPTADMLEDKSRFSGQETSSGVGAGVTVAILVCLLVCVMGWITYAYFFPHTTSGQLLIKCVSWAGLHTHTSSLTRHRDSSSLSTGRARGRSSEGKLGTQRPPCIASTCSVAFFTGSTRTAKPHSSFSFSSESLVVISEACSESLVVISEACSESLVVISEACSESLVVISEACSESLIVISEACLRQMLTSSH
ncbi:hypothetical protein FHG87_005265 [Trinorchestia longiramus]|nr:hypothetical protein FHG87_005265 [Trinorchestia longiramus]